MGNFPFGYQPIETTTWAYLSSLLMLALFFKFNRFWSFRNLDLVLLILLAPGLLMVHYGMNPPDSIRQKFAQAEAEELVVDPDSGQAVIADSPSTGDADDPATPDQNEPPQSNQDSPAPGAADEDSKARGAEAEDAAVESDQESDGPAPQEQWQRQLQYRGFLWLFSIGAIWLLRMLIDPNLVRKPFLESNLSSGGLTFLVCSLMIFLFANIITSRPQAEDISGPRDAVKLLQGEQLGPNELMRRGPGHAFFNLFPTIPTFANDRGELSEDADDEDKLANYVVAAKTMAILSQLAIVLALVFFGRNHFNDLQIGIGMAAIYLMLPYTAIYTGRIMHLLPAALLLWAITMYRMPWLCGVLLGLAGGVTYYPLYLIPLFVSYYWDRGKKRFLIGLCLALSLSIFSLIFTSYSFENFFGQFQMMFGIRLPSFDYLEGIWSLGWYPGYRITLLVGFVAMCVTFAAWPAKKTLGSLVCCSCAAMVAVQFWHGFGGGLYMAWYIPLGLLAFFRPNVEDTTAEKVVSQKSKNSNSPQNPTSQEDTLTE